MIHVVEESLYIRVDHEVYLLCHNQLINLSDGLMAALAFPKPIGEMIKFPFVDLVEYFPHDSLHQFIFICRYSEWPHLVASGFGDMSASNRLRPVAEPFHPAQQVVYVRFEGFPIGFFAHAVYTFGFAFLLPMVFFDQVLLVHIVHQRLYSLVFLGLLRYSFVRICHLSCHLRCG
ncbi:Uncharacterised protein [Mycobacterium tuberculosis]|nr:Uncharacterised protein [Mycobacterium tuberculosis]